MNKLYVRAIDPCVMKDTGTPALTVGKEYEVISVEKDRVKIIDDDNCFHYFILNGKHVVDVKGEHDEKFKEKMDNLIEN